LDSNLILYFARYKLVRHLMNCFIDIKQIDHYFR